MTGGSGVIIRWPSGSRSRCESCRVMQTATELWVWWRSPLPGVCGAAAAPSSHARGGLYVLAGQLSLQVGEEWGSLSVVLAHRHARPRTYPNAGELRTDEGRLLCMFAPGEPWSDASSGSCQAAR